MKKYISIFLFGSLLLASCIGYSSNSDLKGLSFNVINYTTYDFVHINFQNQSNIIVEGAKYLGSYENSGSYCCININNENQLKIEYGILNKNGAEKRYTKNIDTYGKLENKKYLVLHILPGEKFVFETTNESPQPSIELLDQQLRNINQKRSKLDQPWTWRD